MLETFFLVNSYDLLWKNVLNHIQQWIEHESTQYLTDLDNRYKMTLKQKHVKSPLWGRYTTTINLKYFSSRAASSTYMSTTSCFSTKFWNHQVYKSALYSWACLVASHREFGQFILGDAQRDKRQLIWIWTRIKVIQFTMPLFRSKMYSDESFLTH